MEPNLPPTMPNQNPTTEQLKAASVSESSVMPPNPPMQPNKGNVGKPYYARWYFWTIVAVALIAIAGWVVAAYEYSVALPLNDRIAELNNEIAEKNQLLVKYGAELGIKVDQYGRPIQEEKPSDEDVKKANEYIYIGEWGLKFKIPEGLSNVSYLYSDIEYYTETINRATDVCATGTPQEATYQADFGDLRKIGWEGLGCIGRFPIEPEGEIISEEWYNAQREAAVYEDDEYYYVYSTPQAAYSTDVEERQWETAAVGLIREMLTQNIEKFEE